MSNQLNPKDSKDYSITIKELFTRPFRGNSFCTLKTDLDLGPIYHKNDESTMAHLNLGILAYWLVNTISHPLRPKQLNSN